MSREAKLQLAIVLAGLTCVAGSVLGLVALRTRFTFSQGVIPGSVATPFTEVRLREPRQENPPVALLLHGLTANRRIMLDFAESLAAAGLDVYVIDLPGHGDSTEPFHYSEVREAVRDTVRFLVRERGISPERMVLIGHSMGGRLAVETALAMRELGATVAISGLPGTVRRDRPRNLLLFTASFDLDRLRGGAFQMFRQATGQEPVTDKTVGDFSLGTARRLVVVRGTGHTGLIYTTRTTAAIVDWVRQAIPGARLGPPLALARWLALEWVGAIGLILFFAPLAYGLALLLKAAPLGGPAWSSRLVEESPLRLFLFILANAWLAVSLLRMVNLLRFTGVLTGSYVSGFLLIQSLFLWVTLRRGEFCPTARATLKAVAGLVALVLYATLIGGRFLNWQMTDAWPTRLRVERMFALMPFLFVYFLGEEALLRGLERKNGKRNAWAWLVRLRLVALAALGYGVFVLGSSQVLVILMAHIFFLGSLLLFWFSTTLYHRFGSVSGCALFDAILAAWFFATVFPMM